MHHYPDRIDNIPAAISTRLGNGPLLIMNLSLEPEPRPVDKEILDAKDMLKWTPEERVIGFRTTWKQYLGSSFSGQPDKSEPFEKLDFDAEAFQYEIDGQKRSLAYYEQQQGVTGLIVLKNGKVAIEHYNHGNTETTLWTSRSVAKPITTTLIGIAIKEGKIESVKSQLTHYLPKLKGTAWDGCTIEDVLTHTSGVKWNEDYKDPKSDFADMTRFEAGDNTMEDIFNQVSQLERIHAPGKVWSYCTAGSFLLGLLLETAVGMPISKYLETKLWSQYPMESTGVWHNFVEGEHDMGGHGFNARLRDWARVGLFCANNGVLPNGNSLLPEGWFKDATTWTLAEGSVSDKTPNGRFGYQWWAPYADPKVRNSDKTFMGMGIFGQLLIVNPAEQVVIVQWSTWPSAVGSNEDEANAFVRGILHALEG